MTKTDKLINLVLDLAYVDMNRQPRFIVERFTYSGEGLPERFKAGERLISVEFRPATSQSVETGVGRTLEEALYECVRILSWTAERLEEQAGEAERSEADNVRRWAAVRAEIKAALDSQ